MTDLAKLEHAERLLAECASATDAQNIIDLAEAQRVYVKQAKLGGRAVNHATHIKLKAARLLADFVDAGQAAGTIEGHGGDRRSDTKTKVGTSDLGLTKQQVNESTLIRDQFTAEEIQAQVDEANAKGKEISRNWLLQEARNRKRRKEMEQRTKSEPGPMPGGEYNLILADPPWEYPQDSNYPNRKLDKQYPTMPFAELAEMVIPAAKDSVLLMWATSPLLPQQLETMAAWGFDYRTCAIWVKDRIGVGSWWRQQHELLLLGAKGTPGAPLPENRPPSVIAAPRTEHSRKPEAIHHMAGAMFPHLTARLELFARQPVDGWATWGNEA